MGRKRGAALISDFDMLRRMYMLADLDDSELRPIAEAAAMRTYRSKSNVFMEGEERHAVFFAVKGVIKVYKVDHQGNEAIMNFIKPGEMFPHAGFFENAPYPATAEVVLDAELCVIPDRAFERIVLERPETAVKAMRMMGRHIRDLQAKLRDMSSIDIQFRIAAVLIRLAREYGVPEKSGTRIGVRTTNSDLARMAGTTRETVNRFVNRLKREGVLLDEPRQLVVADMHGLERFVQ
ncbi:Crp/Fnr family transcriptional regulator [Paenibacillus flagellatus]|uniref:Crp/Fnr family transcriptional regulator n=1 Tax=Paenibacillus flagellatus TaxID=2211139 RepID=A0A2V5K9N7_9BACL|nr:Crp/Fnr family transcriptional regulator [Paenibacillus flagellatus]PYI56229.1 Crp/Fnr family transcriptional regulator [Paenibacillus flagellatus]